MEGTLFIVGARWSGTLPKFEKQWLANVGDVHDCKRPIARKEVTLGSDPAVGFTQVCGGNLVFTRVLVLHAGFALAISLGAVNASKEATAMDELIGWLSQLTWNVS